MKPPKRGYLGLGHLSFVERLSSLRGLCLNATENLVLIENGAHIFIP